VWGGEEKCGEGLELTSQGLFTSAFLMTALGTGLLISTLTKNQLAASQAAQVVGFLPAYILSGFIFEIASMPKIIQLCTYAIPARYFVSSLLSVFLVGNVWKLLLHNTLIMIFIALIIFGVTSRLIVKRLD
jgi:ABC-2 type transport system permease protein